MKEGPPLEYRRDRPRHTRRSVIAGAIVGVVICGVAFAVLNRPLVYPAAVRRSSVCRTNLRQIGQAALLHANENGGQLPDGVEGLLDEELVTSVFVCPSSGDTVAPPGPTTRATALSVASPGHCSYAYLGKDWRADELTANVVLAYEPLSNHGGVGMNVLFGDGHVEFVRAEEARGIITKVGAGFNPPRAVKPR